VFAALYALYSGLIVLIEAGVLFAPVFNRFLHRFHLELRDDEGKNNASRQRVTHRRRP
jgi:hypothetical protein